MSRSVPKDGRFSTVAFETLASLVAESQSVPKDGRFSTLISDNNLHTA